VRPAALFRGLLIVAVAFAAVSAAIALLNMYGVDTPFDQVAKRLDVDAEATVPAWFSSVTLFFCALLIITIAGQERCRRLVPYWWALAVGFLVLSLDEAASYHELLNEKLDDSGTTGKIVWIFPAFVLVAIVGLAFVGLLRGLPVRYRRLFVMAGFLYVFAALGLEAIGGAIVVSHGGLEAEESGQNLPYIAESTAEELIEMLSVAVFTYALASYAEEERQRAAAARPPALVG
jgi:hypothetical protein